MSERLTKGERLCGEKRISALFANGRRGSEGCLRFVWDVRKVEPTAVSILFSVPKKIFKRAWKRNLMKRRMRESYRRRKSALVERATDKGLILDIALICVGLEKGGPTKGVTPEIPDFKTIDNAIERILEKIMERI